MDDMVPPKQMTFDDLDDPDDYRPIYLSALRPPPHAKDVRPVSRSKFAGLQKKVDKLYAVVMGELPRVDANAEEAQRAAYHVDEALTRFVMRFTNERRELERRIASLEAVVEVLSTDVEEPPSSGEPKKYGRSKYLRGQVREVGGGVVDIIVNSDTMEYPPVGAMVSVEYWRVS